MAQHGLLSTGYREMDVVTLQTVLDKAFHDRHQCYAALIANSLVPVDVYDLTKEELYHQVIVLLVSGLLNKLTCPRHCRWSVDRYYPRTLSIAMHKLSKKHLIRNIFPSSKQE